MADPTRRVAVGSPGPLLLRPALAHIGRYRLDAVLAEDPPSTVYAAWDPLLSRPVAIKTLEFGLGMQARIAVDRRLLQAARGATHLRHRHIATVYDCGLSAQGVYVTSELLRGRDLRQTMAEGWQPRLGDALKLIRRVAEAVAYAHSRGVVHGDLKPSSIFLRRSGRPTVLNFGVARVLGDHTVEELEGSNLGWPHYQAPEQISRHVLDERCDVYALGLMLYELLGGRKAFPRDNLQSLRRAIVSGAWVPLDNLRPDLPACVVRAVHGALATDPQQRTPSAQALGEDLRSAAEEISGLFGPVERPVAAVARAVRQLPSPVSAAVALASRHPAWRWPVAAGALALLAWATAVALRPGAPQDNAPSVPLTQERPAQPVPPEVATAVVPRITSAVQGHDLPAVPPVLRTADTRPSETATGAEPSTAPSPSDPAAKR